MKIAIKHFRKSLTCEQFIITGSYAFRALGLINKVNDLDIILVKPNEESLAILEKLRTKNESEYPEDPGHFVVEFNGIKIDFFCYSNPIKHPIQIAYDGMILFLQPIKEIIKKKKECGSLKQILQLKAISSLFISETEFQRTINKEMLKTIQPLHMKSHSTEIDEDEIQPPKISL